MGKVAGRVEESKGVGYRYFRNTGFVGLRLGVDLQREVFCLFLFIYGCAGFIASRTFSGRTKQGLLCGCGARASRCAGFSCRAQALGHVWASGVASPGL